MVKCLTAQKDVDAVDMVDMVDIMDGGSRMFCAFGVSAAVWLVSLYNTP